MTRILLALLALAIATLHAHDYNTFGAVYSGDLVSVSSHPLYIEDGGGERRVSRKGLVTRKR